MQAEPNSKIDQKLADKIQKLLALATSPNEHEARLAAEKANELLIRHNLTADEVKTLREEDYVNSTVLEHREMPYQCLWILPVMQKHFFVRTVRQESSKKYKTPARIWFVGTPTNVQVASYVFSFLTNKFKDCWIKYRDDRWPGGSGEIHDYKGVYYQGLAAGLSEQLSVKRKQIEQSMALVVVPDPKLETALVRHHPRLRSTTLRPIAHDSSAFWAGKEEGKNIKIARGLGSSGGSTGLSLEHKKGKKQ